MRKFYELLDDAYNRLNEKEIYQKVTYNIIKERIGEMHNKGNLEIIKCKTVLIRPMFLNKMAIKKQNNVFEWKIFYNIKFKKKCNR